MITTDHQRLAEIRQRAEKATGGYGPALADDCRYLLARLTELEAQLAKARASDDYHADALRRVLQESNDLRAQMEHLAQECGPSCAKDIADLRAELARKEEALRDMHAWSDEAHLARRDIGGCGWRHGKIAQVANSYFARHAADQSTEVAVDAGVSKDLPAGPVPATSVVPSPPAEAYHPAGNDIPSPTDAREEPQAKCETCGGTGCMMMCELCKGTGRAEAGR